ncbi:hypothetical protein BC739_001182 [Kutzneria viridogrisea]|uniref:PA14 domain-containing protein n=1 Tax=Kutzneria viridogrisea TaxID=47990 RepID=A0ABR6BAZ1_9PSEU|nr:hypothetical protein [Kutzneria viridogrisea]
MRGQIADVRRAVGLASATITKGGLKLLSGAFLSMVNSTGVQVLYIGPDGAGYQGIVVRRRTGSLVMSVQHDNTSNDDFWAMWDKAGNIVLSDDIQAGAGLARPYLDLPLYPGNVNQWCSTTSSSFASVYSGDVTVQHANWDWSFNVTDNGCSGEVRMMVDGVQLGPTFTYTQGNPTSWQLKVAHGKAIGSTCNIQLQARRTSGTTSNQIAISPSRFRGVQS